jgi:hypothetical protein
LHTSMRFAYCLFLHSMNRYDCKGNVISTLCRIQVRAWDQGTILQSAQGHQVTLWRAMSTASVSSCFSYWPVGSPTTGNWRKKRIASFHFGLHILWFQSRQSLPTKHCVCQQRPGAWLQFIFWCYLWLQLKA